MRKNYFNDKKNCSQFDSSLTLLAKYLYYKLELKKIVPLAIICYIHKNLLKSMVSKIKLMVLREQKKDGGWNDLEESVYCGNFLLLTNKDSKDSYTNHSLKKFINFITLESRDRNAFGNTKRDRMRIGITSRVLIFLSKINNRKININPSLNWLHEEYSSDLKKNILVCYKAADILLVNFIYNFLSKKEVANLINFLYRNKQKDGWGVRKRHPAGSIPSITGKVLLSLKIYEKKYPTIQKMFFSEIDFEKLGVNKKFYKEHPQEKAQFWMGLFKLAVSNKYDYKKIIF